MRDFPDEVGPLRCPECGATESFVLEGLDRVVFRWRPRAEGAGQLEVLESDGLPAVEDRCLVWCDCGHQGPFSDFEILEA